MKFVRTTNDIIESLDKMEVYLNGTDANEKKLAGAMIANSDALVIYKVEGINHFAPGRFCAYKGNNLKNDAANTEYISKDANKALTKVVGKEAFTNKTIVQKFNEYCAKLKIKPTDNPERNFWRLYEGGSYLEL